MQMTPKSNNLTMMNGKIGPHWLLCCPLSTAYCVQPIVSEWKLNLLQHTRESTKRTTSITVDQNVIIFGNIFDCHIFCIVSMAGFLADIVCFQLPTNLKTQLLLALPKNKLYSLDMRTRRTEYILLQNTIDCYNINVGRIRIKLLHNTSSPFQVEYSKMKWLQLMRILDSICVVKYVACIVR